MDFNFSNLANTNFQSNGTVYLKPYNIYKVNLTKIEKTELKGSKDPNATYPIVTLEFTGCGDDKGVFSTNLFIPTSADDTKRPVFQNANGHEYERPSRMENFQYTLLQLVHVLNPGQKSPKATGEIAIRELLSQGKIKTVDQFIDIIIKALQDKNTVETNLKLVGRTSNGTVYSALPNACGINKAGEIFPINFIGENLFFSNYELNQQKAYQNAKPTNMEKIEESDNSIDDVDLNIDDIEL